MLTAAEIAAALGRATRNSGGWLACCCCCHEDRTPSLSLRDGDNGKLLVKCFADCDARDILDELRGRGWLDDCKAVGKSATLSNGQHKLAEFSKLHVGKPGTSSLNSASSMTTPAPKPAADNSGKARWLWKRSRPIQATIAEIYLRAERGITCSLPATLRFLPASDQYPPSMIAPFVIPGEIEPGKLAVNADQVDAVHITRLTPDGHKHPDDPAKITLGSASGLPIVLAPMNDLLGLAITEGIEDALSVHQATGLGAWAAGTAGRMPALAEAVPDYADCVSIIADADTTGQNNAARLAEALDGRGIQAQIIASAESGT